MSGAFNPATPSRDTSASPVEGCGQKSKCGPEVLGLDGNTDVWGNTMRAVGIVSILGMAVLGATGCSSSGGGPLADGPPAVDCVQNGFYGCAGDFPQNCLDVMAQVADLAVPYRAGLYPVGAIGDLGSALDRIASTCGPDGVDAFISEFPDMPELVRVYG